MTYTIKTWTDVLIETELDDEIEVEIAYDFVPGSPDTYDAAVGGPGGWNPGWSDEVDFISAEVNGHGIDQGRLDAWAERWLNNEGYDAAVANAVRSKP